MDKFLNGLGPKYQVFLTAFLQSHSLLPERNLEGIVIKAATTIEEATRAAEQEEHSQRMQQQDQDQEQSSTLLWSLPSRSKISLPAATARDLGTLRMDAGYFTPSLRND
jgi:hypothetical protein